jgi:hypothetical protein
MSTDRELLRLPASLDALDAVETLRERILAGSLRLDWSAVTTVDPTLLARLLAGLDAAAHAEPLNLDSAPPELAIVLRRILLARAAEPPAQLLQPPPPRELRDALENALIRDLLGPAGGPDEVIDERRVRDRYLVGLVAPKDRRSTNDEPQDAFEVASAGDDEGPSDAGNAPPEVMFPASIGLSFAVTRSAQRVRVTARWGRYQRTKQEATGDEEPTNPVWQRVPMTGSVLLDLAPGSLRPRPFTLDQPQVLLAGVARELADRWLVTLFLVNAQREPEKLRDEAWLFQPELEIRDPDNRPIFTSRQDEAPPGIDLDPDLRVMDMLYRDRREFAVGHAIGVHAEVDPTDPTHAHLVRTAVVPTHEVPQQSHRDADDDPLLAALSLDMKELAEAPRAELGKKLRALPDAYAAWIRRQRERIADPAARLAGFEREADQNLRACDAALGRIRDGLALLATDEKAAEAFRFANRAMHLQRLHSVFVERVRSGAAVPLESLDIPQNRSWRAFQLAFILLNLDSVTSLHHPHRSDPNHAIADLLWFPTGGGKTEAYLGLAAYVMALRRLQGVVAGRSGEYGVAVLMRYTLRLLTLQQFQRAATLICACETIRREADLLGDPRWGHEPFRIGLWVGARTTPNTTADASEALHQAKVEGGRRRTSNIASVGTPIQLAACPWCGTPIEPGRNIRVDPFQSGSGRTLIFCGDPRGACPFSEARAPGEGLPVLVVDEEIYRRLPALLIATVDKFAQMPWNGRVQALFGQITGRCERHGFVAPEIDDSDHPRRGDLPSTRIQPHAPLRPPDLIIQDELHLISGPLGTLTGLYETAVDDLCAWDVGGTRVRPKVIASTATIRRASAQIRALFLRDVNVFPPPGLDASDNFFAVERPPSELPGRRYLGICANGRRFKAALIRVYIAVLASAQQLYDRHGAHTDPWMTLVGYFNALRELAGMRRMVDDDVRTRLRRMDQRGLAPRKSLVVEELTSRLGATEIPVLLDRLERPFEGPSDEAPPAFNRRPLDVLLATNMISVGVDVKRLGLMVTAGQPKTTAEYIQATSRVGRSKPGLVVTIYNWTRPRDLSHYETFEHYHATFYRHVEALSITPFAARARDRGLSALLVAMIRLGDRTYARNLDAQHLDGDSDLVTHAIDAITSRAVAVEGDPRIGPTLRQDLRARVDAWLAAARRTGGARLGYRTSKDGRTIGLLKSAGDGAWETFTCLNSLRDVEATTALILKDGGLDDEPPPPTAPATPTP